MRSQRQIFQGRALRRLLGDQRGALMAIMGLAIIPLFAAIGLAIDSGRGYMLKSKLSYAIDAAGLAGGRAFETDLREEDIMMFFEANFPPGYMNSELAPGHPDITFDDEENTITIEASATIPTHFMRVAGVHDMTVSARTVIKRELRGMELVLVMDNTGSMRGNGGMAAMKPAATELVDILYGDREEVPSFWVGVVPYAANVNIGTQHDDWLISQAYDEDAAWQNADPDSETRFGYHPDHYQPTDLEGLRRGARVPARQQRRPARRRGLVSLSVAHDAPTTSRTRRGPTIPTSMSSVRAQSTSVATPTRATSSTSRASLPSLATARRSSSTTRPTAPPGAAG